MYLLVYNEANNGKIRDEPNQKKQNQQTTS